MSAPKDVLDEIRINEEKILEVLDGILETIDVLNSAEDINFLKKSLKDIETGKIFPLKTSGNNVKKRIEPIYTLKCTATFKKEMTSIADNVKVKILAILENLKTDPYSVRYLRGHFKELYRLRIVGKNLFYAVKDETKSVIVLTITEGKYALPF